jgi:DNA polymerase
MSEDAPAGDRADGADELDADLRVTACERCPALVDSRSRIVNGVGPADAALLFVGEAPGEQEDAAGEPFVGRSGDVLEAALRDVGLARSDVRITNCVRCRPPGNRDPHVDERENCRGYLEAEVARVDPDLVVTLGKVPSEHVLGRSVAVTSEAGSVVDARLGGAARRVLVSVHPAATLYDRSQRGTFESAVETAADLVDAGRSGGGTGGQSRLGDY